MAKGSNHLSSREAVMHAAEHLFVMRGYTAVTLKHLANELGMKQASLYYHFPNGKEELYVEVMVRHLEHRKAIVEKLIAQSEPTLRDCLVNVGTWLIQQIPLHAGRMFVGDLPELSPENSTQLEESIYCCVFAPIEGIFVQYKEQIKEHYQADLGFISGTFLCSLESLYTFKQYGSKTDDELVNDLIDLLLAGSLG